MVSKAIFFSGAFAFAMMFSSSVNASLTVSFNVNKGSDMIVTVSDNGAGDADANVNAIQTTQSFNGYTFTITVVNSNAPGSGVMSGIDVQSVTITGDGPAVITVTAASSPFYTPTAPPSTLITADSSMTAKFNTEAPAGSNADVTYDALVNGSSVGSGADTLDKPGDVGTFLSDSSGLTSLTGGYELMLVMTADITTSAVNMNMESSLELTGDIPTNPQNFVPEPTAIFVWSLLSVLCCVACYRRNGLIKHR